MNVLVVEPDALSAQYVCDQFAAHGADVFVAQSGQQAVDILDSASIDCIVLEPQIGIHNGVEFLYELRSYNDWQHIPVVIWTLNQTLVHGRFAKPWRELGVTELLYKPHVSLAQLWQAAERQVATVL
jgi:DNA-binding response OmpR family regulator